MPQPQPMLYYTGNRQSASSNNFIENINPATGKLIGTIETASESDIEAAVSSAKEGYAVWSAMSPTARGRILRKAEEIMRGRNEEIERIEVEDSVKHISEAITVDINSEAAHVENDGGLDAT